MSTTNYANEVLMEVKIVSITCHACGVPYGLGANFIEQRKRDQRTFYCPNGHPGYWPKPTRTEADVLRDELAAARSLAQRESRRRELAERQRSAAKGQVTKLKRRAANGVCPCCNRTFVNVGRHMAGQHPEFASETKP